MNGASRIFSTDIMNKNSPLRVYIVAGHITWLILSPLLLFIGGGGWLVNRFNMSHWWMIVFVLLGLTMMVSGVWSYMKQLLNMFDDLRDNPDNTLSPELKDKRDYDY